MFKRGKNDMGADAISSSATTVTRRADDITTLEVVLHEASVRDLKIQRCIAILTGWVNEAVEPTKMLVQDFFDDLHDGKILIKLIEMKTGDKLKVALSALSYKAILENVKQLTNYMLNTLKIPQNQYWTPETMAAKQVPAVLFVVKDLADHFGMTDPLPANAELVCLRMEKKEEGHIERKVVKYPFTQSTKMPDVVKIHGNSDDEDDLAGDVFDKLLLASAEKVDQVRQLLIKFANQHLYTATGNPQTIREFGINFSDGDLFVKLLCVLGGFYIARNEYFSNPKDNSEKLHNMKVVMSLMSRHGVVVAGLKKQEMANGEEGAIMRSMYRIYQHFKNVT